MTGFISRIARQPAIHCSEKRKKAVSADFLSKKTLPFGFLGSVISQLTLGIHSMLFHCWTSVEDAEPTVKQHWVKASCLLGRWHL